MTAGQATASSRYRQLWTLPGAPRLLIGGVVARLGQGVTVLAWILLIRETTGSFTAASLVAAAISLATAAAAPVGGRLADRFGPARVLPWYGCAYAAAQLALLAAVLTRQPLPLLCLLAAVSGALFPATSPALRAAWTTLTADGTGKEPIRSTAMAAESTLFELIYVVGPLLLSAAMLIAGPLARLTGTQPDVSGPASAIVLAAACAAAGTTALARGYALRRLRPNTEAPTRGLGPLRVAGMPALLACAAGVAFSFGASPVAVAAFATVHDGDRAAAVTGVLIAVWSLGSAAAGLWYGSRTWHTPLTRQLTWLLGGLALGYTAWMPAPNSLVLGAVLVLTGAVIAPVMTVQAGLVAQIAPASMLTESYTWFTTVNLAMAALGSAVAGVVVDGSTGAVGGFGVCALATAVAAVLAVWPGLLSPRRYVTEPQVSPQ